MPVAIGAATLSIIGGIAGAVLNTKLALSLMLITIVFTLLMRIFFMFVKAYLSIILLVIFGPLIIAFSSFLSPNSNKVMLWFKTLLANILIFPVSAFIMGLGGVLISRLQTQGQTLWGPPLIGSDPQLIAGAIGLGIILMIPELEGIISRLLGISGMPMGAPPSMDIAGEIKKGIQEGWSFGRQTIESIQKIRAMRAGGGGTLTSQ